jgi:signal recognition particle subunit SRP72
MPSGSKVTQDTAPGSSAAAVAAASDVKGKGKAKPRHRLPKGAVIGAKFEEDVSAIETLLCLPHLSLTPPAITRQPDRWLPLKQRASYLSSLTASGGRRRKGAAKKEGMGTGMTQGSADGGGGGSGSSTPVVGGGGRGGKKGRKGR